METLLVNVHGSRVVMGIHVQSRNLVRQLKQLLELHCRTLQILKMGQNGDLPPGWIPPDWLIQIRNEIKQATKNLVFPISEKCWRLYEISKIFKVDLVNSKGRFLVYIQLPLVDCFTYELHRLNLLAAMQSISAEINVAAYIEPSNRYSGVSEE